MLLLVDFFQPTMKTPLCTCRAEVSSGFSTKFNTANCLHVCGEVLTSEWVEPKYPAFVRAEIFPDLTSCCMCLQHKDATLFVDPGSLLGLGVSLQKLFNTLRFPGEIAALVLLTIWLCRLVQIPDVNNCLEAVYKENQSDYVC